MKIRAYPVSISTPAFSTIVDTLSALPSFIQTPKDAASETFGAYPRAVYVDTTTDSTFIYGLVLTIKDHKRFCQMTPAEGKWKIRVQEIGEKDQLMDFNYFVVRKDTGRGVYQHHHNSCSINQTSSLLGKLTRRYRAYLIDAEISAISPNNDISKSKKNQIQKKYKGRLQVTPIIRPEDYDELAEKLSQIKYVQYDMDVLHDKDSPFKPVQDLVKKKRETVRFVRKTPAQNVLKIIKNVFDKGHVEKGKIFGIDQDGHEARIDLEENIRTYDEQDFDDIVKTINDVEIDDLPSNPIITKLQAIVESHDEIFKTPCQ